VTSVSEGDGPRAEARDGAAEARLRLLSLASFLIVWQAAAMILASRFLPTPVDVAAKLAVYLADGEIYQHLRATLRRVFFSFVAAMAIGAALGVVMGRRRRLDALLDGWLLVFLNIPALVVTVLCYIWLGLNEVAAVAAVAINKIPTVAVIVREGARAVDQELLQVAKVYRLSAWRTFVDVYLPQLFPSMVAAARAGLALIWKIVLVVELLGRSDGVGFQISVFFQFFDIESILAYAFAFIAVVVAIEYALVKPAERRLTRWRR
jgi:NitT/TauT family transport system permease protein